MAAAVSSLPCRLGGKVVIFPHQHSFDGDRAAADIHTAGGENNEKFRLSERDQAAAMSPACRPDLRLRWNVRRRSGHRMLFKRTFDPVFGIDVNGLPSRMPECSPSMFQTAISKRMHPFMECIL